MQRGRTTAKRKIKSIQPYMAILYEECLDLYHKGVRTWDAYKQEFFQLRMLVFDVICDFPGPLTINCRRYELDQPLMNSRARYRPWRGEWMERADVVLPVSALHGAW